MITKGSPRGGSISDVDQLAAHLQGEENEKVRIVEHRGVVGNSLHAMLQNLRRAGAGSRARKVLYHASINVSYADLAKMSDERWLESVDELESRLGFRGHPRLVIMHWKKGRIHIHIVWLRVDPETHRVPRDSWSYRIHEETSRELERRFGLQPLIGAHTRPDAVPRPVAVMTHQDWQAQERTGVSVEAVSAAIREAWDAATSGEEFVTGLSEAGLIAARGRRGLVVLDEAGTPHSLARRLKMKAAAVQERLADVDVNCLPSVDTVKAQLRREKMDEDRKKRKQVLGEWGVVEDGFLDELDGPIFSVTGDTAEAIAPEQRVEIWETLGLEAEIREEEVWVSVGGALVKDLGSKIELHGAISEEACRLMLEAGLARGWTHQRILGDEEFCVTMWRLAQEMEPPIVIVNYEPPDIVKRRLIPSDDPEAASGYRPSSSPKPRP